jgi:molybdate transport system substrate-binding protein
LTLALGACRHSQPEPLRVAAAADLSLAFAEMGTAFEKRTGRRVVFSFGASGLLERQIAEGAPFDAFAAADTSYADEAVRSGACRQDTKAIYATGHIVLYQAAGAPFRVTSLADLADPRIARIAIANPQHAPYGRAAKQALERAGVWNGVQSKLVYGENVQQTLEFARSGNADAAIVAQSLSIGAPGESAPIEPALHDPIAQALVVCSNGRAGWEQGLEFARFVQSADGQAILRRYGFSVPDSPAAAPAPKL